MSPPLIHDGRLHECEAAEGEPADRATVAVEESHHGRVRRAESERWCIVLDHGTHKYVWDWAWPP